MRRLVFCAVFLSAMVGSGVQAQEAAGAGEGWKRTELTDFMRELADFVIQHHMRRDDSEMRGMVYEFYMPSTGKKGNGGGWDTMHDGAWFANACILAYRATKDPVYLDAVQKWVLPFYIKMLNHSDALFADREKAYSDGELLPPDRCAAGKGFVPYWWDDGYGVNFDAIAQKITVADLIGPNWGFTNLLAADQEPAREGRLAGYSHGTSNHMALAMFPMLANGWLLTRDPDVAQAIHNLRESRIRQMKMDLPFLAAADAASHGDEKKAHEIAAWYDVAPWPPETPLYQAMVAKKKVLLTPFLDDPAGRYYASMIGKQVGEGTAKRLSQMTYDCLCLEDLWFGSGRRPRGLAYAADSRKQVWIEDGKFSSLAGELPDVLVGSRMGPQSLWACAQGLQLLRAFPRAWEECYKSRYSAPIAGWSEPALRVVELRLREEVEEGLRFWRDQMRTVGFIRPDWPIGGKRPAKYYWSDRASETGGYAHLIAACAEYIMLLDGQSDWELAWSLVAP